MELKEYIQESVKNHKDKKLAKITVAHAGTTISALKYELTSITDPLLKRTFWHSKGISNSMAFLITKHLF